MFSQKKFNKILIFLSAESLDRPNILLTRQEALDKITPRPSPRISPSASVSASPARPGQRGSFKKQDSYNKAIEKGYDMLTALERINNYEEVLRDLKEKNR